MSQFLPTLYDVFHSFPIIGPLLPRRADREVGTISLTQAYRNAVTELSLRPTLGQHEASSTNKSSNAVLDGEELDEACNFMRTWMNRVRDDAQSGDPFECPTNSHSSLHHIRCPPSVSIQHCSTRRESSLLDPFLIEVMMHVESLDLSGHQELTGRAVELLAQRWLNVRSVIQSTEGALLTRVNLSNCPIGDDGAMQLAQLIHLQGGSSPLLVRLRTLVLDAVDLTDEGCFTICTALTALHRFRRRQADHPSLFTPFRRLSLKNNHLSHRSVEVVLQTALEDHPSSSSTTDGSLVIQTVNLSFNNLHQEAATTTTTAYAVGMRLSSWAAFTSQDGSEDDNDDGDSTLSNAAHSSTTSSLVALREGLRRDGYLDDGEGHERGFCVLLVGCEWGTRDFSNMLLGIIAGYSPTLSEVVSAVAALISADTATRMNVPTDTPRIECEEGEESQEEEVESSSLTSDPPAASPLFGAVRPLLLLHHQQLNFLRCLDLSYTALDDCGVVELVHVILSLEEVCSGVLSVGLQRFSCLPHEEHRLGSLAHPLALLEELRLRGIGCTARSLPWLATLLLPLWEAPPTDDTAAAATSISDVDEEASEGDSASLSGTSASVGAGMGRGVPSTAFLVSESYWRPAGSAVVESCASMEREVEGLQDLHELTSFAMHDVAEDSAVTPRPHASSMTTPPVRSHPDEGLHGATFPTIVRHFMLPNLRCLDLSENQLGEAPPSRRRRKHGCSGALLAAAVLRGSMRRTFDRHASHAAEETGRRSRSAVRHSCGEAGASNVADNHHGVDESEEDGAFSLGLDGCGLGDHAITVGLVVLAERHAFSQWSNPERNARGVTYHLGNNHFTHAGLVSLRMAVESTLKVNRQDSHYLYHVGRLPMAEGWVEGNYILADLSAATTAEHSISWTSLANLEECPEKAPPTEVPAFASFLSQLRQASEEALYSPSLADQLSVTGLTSAMREQLLYSPRPRQGFTESTVAAPQVTAPLAEFQERTTEAKDQEVAGGATAAETLDLLIKGTDQFLAERIATSRRRELATVDKDSTAVLASSLFGATVGGQK